MRRFLTVAVVALAAAICPTAAGAATAPYGENDAGGFRNVLPPGTNGLDNALDLARFSATGQRPPHYDDQQPLYENLLYASPKGLTNDQLSNYFKDATFGIQDGDVGSTTTPRAGVTIVRDKSYGVPHVYGVTRGDVMFGAGYAAAQDRLFLIDILRHTGRAQLSSFVGGSPSNREMDRTQWGLAPYTEADLQSQVDNAPKLYGAKGTQIVDDVTQFVAGINQYIDEARLDPTKLPSEYAALGKTPQHWTPTDVVAEASLIGGIFGKGGGREVDSAQTLQAFTKRFGTKKGRRAWSDFRQKNDPEAPTMARKRFPYETTSPFAKRGLAIPDRGSVTDVPPAPPVPQSSKPASGRFAEVGAQLLRIAQGHPHASNWELVSAKHSKSGHPIAVMGPQVGYYVPQILMEEELHGGGIDAAGAAFPGVNLYVELGHGRDYAWSATTANSDNVDTFAEVLCQDDFHYMYKGQCLPMERLDRTNSWTPSAVDQTPPGSETLTVYRTVHGIVYARGTVRGKKVAFARSRTTYFHEADSAYGFSQYNEPATVHDAQSFQRAAANINFGFNWAYVDSDDIAYFQSGWYPRRAKGTSPDFPILGTGEYDWQDYNTELHTVGQIKFSQHPQAINPPYLVSWNNKQAPGWAAADDNYGYGPLYRSQMIEAFIKRGIKGGKKMDLAQLVQAMEEPATQDIRAVKVLPVLLPLIEGKLPPGPRRARTPRRRSQPSAMTAGRRPSAVQVPPLDPRLRAPVKLLKAWVAAGGHRRDLDKDGRYDNDDAVTLMDAWWPHLMGAMFKIPLGNDAFKATRRMIAFGDPIGTSSPEAPAFSDGWWGYAYKDLRDAFPRGRKLPRGHWSRVYCGTGPRLRNSRAVCISRLRRSLLNALKVNRPGMYGHGDCEDNPQALCWDMNRPTVTSAVDMPPFPLQNRPTFQQTVELSRRLPR